MGVWATSAGRWRRAQAGWVPATANEERTYTDASGQTRGFLMEGADTFHSAPWHDAAAPHTSGDPAYLAKSVGGDAIAYAGAHSTPDIMGTTGKGVLLTQSATAGGIFTASNVEIVVTGTSLVRVSALVTLGATAAGGSFTLRQAFVAFAFNYDATGNIVSMDAQGSTNDNSAGYQLMPYADSAGGKVWLVWWQRRRTAGTYEAAIGLPTAVAGRTVMVHDLRIQKDPVLAPSGAPVLAANKTFAADTVATGVTQQVGALIHGVARCRTRITDGLLYLKPDTYLGGDWFPLVPRIELIQSAETADRVGILPNINQRYDFLPWGNPAPLALNLGPARFQQDVITGFGVATVSTLTINSAFRADPLLFGWLDGRLAPIYSYQTGAIDLDDLLIFPTNSINADLFEQIDISTADIHVISTNGTSFSSQRSLWLGHPPTHSRARKQAQADDNVLTGPQVWLGGIELEVRGASMACNISGSSFQCVGRGLSPFAAGTAVATRPIQFLADDVFYWNNWSDSLYIAYGDWAGSSFDRQFHGQFSAARSDLYQTRKQIEVNVGAGWVALSAAGLTENDLPLGRWADHVGTWNFTNSTLDTSTAVAGHRTLVRSWNLSSVSGGPLNRPGYQFHARPIDMGNYERGLTVGETFVIAQELAPSPSTPWVRLVADLGYWNGTTHVATSGPAFGATGTHADVWQTITASLTLSGVSSDGMVVMADTQGPFMQGGGAGGTVLFGDIDFSNTIIVTPQSNAFLISLAGGAPDVTLTNALVMPSKQPGRFANGSRGGRALIRSSGAPAQITLANVWYGSNSGDPVGELGGVINGTTNEIAVGTVTNFDVFVDPVGVPAVNQMAPPQFIDPVSKDLDLDLVGHPVETGFAFSAYAETTTGLPLNATLQASLVTGRKFKPLADRMMAWQRDPDLLANVPATTAVGTTISLRQFLRFVPESTLAAGSTTASAWKDRYGGNEAGYFAFDGNGGIKVARPLTGINRLFLLMTANDEMLLLDVA